MGSISLFEGETMTNTELITIRYLVCAIHSALKHLDNDNSMNTINAKTELYEALDAIEKAFEVEIRKQT